MPFNSQQFLDVFEAYNIAVFPMQFLLAASALSAIFLVVKIGRHSSKAVTAILVFLWLWMGVVYHWLFFSSINPIAVVFGAFFILQAGLFLYAGVLQNKLSFRFRVDARGLAGILLIVYSLLVYPILGFVFGHTYPHSPTFGLPCPTVIFTFGLLLWTNKRVPLYILAIPFAWSLLGFSAAILLGMFEDVGLLIAGLVATLLLIRGRNLFFFAN